jgi:hypothetical protein
MQRTGLVWVSLALACLVACGKEKSNPTEPTQADSGVSGATSDSGGALGTTAGTPAPGVGGSGGSGMSVSGAGMSGAMPAAGSGSGMTAGMAAAGSTATAGMNAGDGGAAGMQTGGTGGTGSSADGCTRELLKSTVDAYYTALAAHDASTLPLADDVKFTENGEALEVGEGLWRTGGMVKFKQSALDTQTCMTVTESVVPDGNTDIPLGLRLKLVAQRITEIETIAVRSGDYLVASNTGNMIALASDSWETIVPEAQRPTRDQLESWINKYFKMFPMGGCNLASGCRRMENGFSLGCSVGATCSTMEPGSGAGVMEPRLIVVDVEAGMAAGFVMFMDRYSDFHLIKLVGGQVQGVHTILGSAESSGWD